MLDGLKRKLAAGVIGSFVKKMATSPDTQTTALGFAAAAIIAKQVDFNAVLSCTVQSCNYDQVGTLLLAIVVGLLGWRANKQKTTAGEIVKSLF
jgi:hypothetical protein